MSMRIGQTEEPNWFWRRKLRVERDLYITRNKFYAIGWAHGKARSRYRTWDGPFRWTPVLPWRHPRPTHARPPSTVKAPHE